MPKNFVTTLDILKNPWNDEFHVDKSVTIDLPARTEWLYKTELKIEDVRIWEKIYYDPGIIGIYAAWDPYAEFYIITHPSHPKLKFIQAFYGKDAQFFLEEEVKKYGVQLPKNRIWIDHSICAYQNN